VQRISICHLARRSFIIPRFPVEGFGVIGLPLRHTALKRNYTMNTTGLVAAFIVIISGLIWVGTNTNDDDWTGNRNQCIDECYEDWKATNGGGIADVEQAKQVALAAATPAALGEKYYGQCIACHGGRGEGGIGPQLAGQVTTDIVAKLTAYRAGEERGAQSAMMYPVAKPMTDQDINNIAAYVSDL